MQDLAGALEGEGPFTVFAPINNAFAALPSETLSALFADKSGSLRTTLLQHVGGEMLMSSNLSDGQVITTLDGKELTVSINDDGVFINNAKVVKADIRAENGVVHLIMEIIN